jgi:hypothetical protein
MPVKKCLKLAILSFIYLFIQHLPNICYIPDIELSIKGTGYS